MSGHVVVVGSVNMDLAVRTTRLPRPGETLMARSFHRSQGGKGANQAVGASRAGGAQVSMVGAVGRDADGEALVQALVGDRIDVGRVQRLDDQPTGVALITIDSAAENTIVVAAGANAAFVLSDLDREVIATADVVLAQLEVPQSVVLAAARGRGSGVPFVLNAAPSAPLGDGLLDEVDVLVVNEHEAIDLAGVSDLDQAIEILASRVPQLLVTLGARGARLLGRDGTELVVPAPRVEAVDTVGAGDTFCGVYAAGLAQGLTHLRALQRASAAASLAVQRRGAQDSVPTSAEVDKHVRTSYGPADE